MIMHKIRNEVLSSPFSCMIAPITKAFLPPPEYFERKVVYLATTNLTIQSDTDVTTVEAHQWRFDFQESIYIYWDAAQTRLPLQVHTLGSNYTFLHFATGPQTVLAHNFLLSSIVPSYETCSTLGRREL